MYHTNKVKMLKNIQTKDIIDSEKNVMCEVLTDDRYKLFREAFKNALEHYLENPELPDELNFIFRYIVNDEHARYLRHFEIGCIFFSKISKEKSIRYELVFELYTNNEKIEKCDLLSYYTAEYKDENMKASG